MLPAMTQETASSGMAERSVPHAREVADVAGFEAAPIAGGHVHRPRWQIFLPTAAIALLYAGFWFWLHVSGMTGGALSRLALIVLTIGVPLVAAHAFLRLETTRVQVLDDVVRYHAGWPRDMPVDMPFELIDRVDIRRGLSGRIFGGGTLVLRLTTGESAAIADLADPYAAKAEMDSRM
jgi:membrane protein YdbS with pleckstrin-like domain